MPFHRLFLFRTFRPVGFRGFRKRWVWSICVLFLCVLIVLFAFKYGLVCTGWQALAAVNELCRLYRDGKVAGNLCQDLCTTGTVVLGKCHRYHVSKDIVIAAQWQEKPIVLKTRHTRIDEYDRIATEKHISHYPSVVDFAHMVRTMLRYNFNVSLGRKMESDTSLLTYLWSSSFKSAMKSSQSYIAAVDSIWSLVQQNEYILFKYFENYNVFPKVYGTCGHIYAVEHIQTKAYSLNNWSSRLAYALKVLKLLSILQTGFHQPLYLCDIKPEHFGLASNSDMKVIDADTVFFQSVINKMVKSAQPCSTHEDCAFWDCKSKCRLKEHVCQEVKNNNLQMVCEHLFLRRTGPQWNWLSQPGVLYSAQTNSILNSLLLECSNPSDETDPDLRIAASGVVLDRLHMFLLHDLSNQNHINS